jgi:hypothetical protein
MVRIRDDRLSRAGEFAAGSASSAVPLDLLGAAIDGASGFQPAVPLFRWFVGLGLDEEV